MSRSTTQIRSARLESKLPWRQAKKKAVLRKKSAIKRRCASMMGFKSFENASIALAGVGLAHRIRKRQFSFGRGRPPRRSMRAMWAMVMV
jgi:transposase-like protein